MKYFLVFSSFLLIMMSCKNQGSVASDSTSCATKPSAIFSDTMSIVNQHSFEVNGQNSNEEVFLNNGLQVEVLQSGCQFLRQEFRITREGDFKKMEDPFWVAVAYQTLGLLSEQSIQLKGLEQYASIIAQNAENTKLGQPFFPDPTISISIDKIVNEEKGSSIIVMQEIDQKK